MYLANPCGPNVLDQMHAQTIGYIDTPRQGNRRPTGVTWCADNGCFSDKWDADKWWAWLVANARDAATCLFAVAPDVVGDAWRTHIKSLPWLPKIKALGYPVAYVMQDGAENHPIPWHDFDVAFIGGTTEWKLGPAAREIVAEAKRRSKHVHMGRVNSQRRFEYARAIGCDSADGTFLTRGPDTNLPHLLSWVRGGEQDGLFSVADGGA